LEDLTAETPERSPQGGGRPPTERATQAKAGDLRVLTWNVHKGIGGLDRRYVPWRISAVIRYHDPDVALLQEVTEGMPRSRHDRQAAWWSAALGYRWCLFWPTVRLEEGRYGNAILSRFPIRRATYINLSFPMRKRRGALAAEVLVPGRGGGRVVHVVNLHLGLSGVERRWQIRRLLASRPVSRFGPRSRVVIAGDLNDWAGALGRRRGALRAAGYAPAWGHHHGPRRTFPAWAPVAALDRVFVGGPLACVHVHRSGHTLARRASDHLPVIADLDVRRA
jgi:endonuclease/exonuclease/phosphatase family metal-dependent hydrolase